MILLKKSVLLLFLFFISFGSHLCLSLERKEVLPKNLIWEKGDKEALWASDKAKQGGVLNVSLSEFPMTLRQVGPDSNTYFRTLLDANMMGLVDIHPNSKKPIPSLAISWAYAKDHKTIYYKINPKARWSDGQKVTVDDFIFTLEFMRSPFIMSPWYNNYYNENFEKIIKYDDLTMALVSKEAKSKMRLHFSCNISPYPKHFFKGQVPPNFVKDFNWTIIPNTGPYYISYISKGNSITFEKNKNWWAKDEFYNKNRFNVERVHYIIMRDDEIAYDSFLKRQLDFFDITQPDYWHKKSKGPEYDKGYLVKAWIYTNNPQPDIGIWLNTDQKPLDDMNVRLGIAYSLNFDKVLKNVLYGDYDRLNTGYTGYGPYTNKEIKARPYDLEKAKEYFAKASYIKRNDEGILIHSQTKKPLSLTLTYGVASHTDRLVVLKEDALKAGLDIKLKLIEGGMAFKSLILKQFEMGYTAWGPQTFPDFWGRYHSENAHKPQTNNISNISDRELDNLINEFRKEYDEKKLQLLSKKIQKRIYDLGINIPAWSAPFFREAYWPWWQFPKVMATADAQSLFNPFGTGGIFWFDEKIYQETIEGMKKNKSFPQKSIKSEEYREGSS